MSAPEPVCVLFLRLEGVLQSWGDDARWSVRRTRGEPTKSGVIGLLAAAKGWGLSAEGDRHVERLGRELRMAVRADRPGGLLREAASMAAVDYGLMPKRLTPGWEHEVGRCRFRRHGPRPGRRHPPHPGLTGTSGASRLPPVDG